MYFKRAAQSVTVVSPSLTCAKNSSLLSFHTGTVGNARMKDLAAPGNRQLDF
jgi:hypothetical protein